MVCEQVEAAVCPEGGDPAGFGDVVGSGEAVHVQNCVSQAGHDLWGGAGVHGAAVNCDGTVSQPPDPTYVVPQTRSAIPPRRSIRSPLDIGATFGRGTFALHLTGASPQPDEACRWSPRFGGSDRVG